MPGAGAFYIDDAMLPLPSRAHPKAQRVESKLEWLVVAPCCLGLTTSMVLQMAQVFKYFIITAVCGWGACRLPWLVFVFVCCLHLFALCVNVFVCCPVFGPVLGPARFTPPCPQQALQHVMCMKHSLRFCCLRWLVSDLLLCGFVGSFD